MKVEALAVDVDGTLTDADGRLELAAVEKVRKVEAAGWPVILSTARSIYTAAMLARLIGTCEIVMGENGAVLGRGWRVLRVFGDPKLALEGYRVLREKLGEKVQERGIQPRMVDIALERSFPLEEGNRILRDHGVGVRVYDSGFAYHLLPAGVDKGSGLKKLAELFHLDSGRIVAVGDGLNDVELFQAAGYGIALAQAPEELKKIADHVTSKSYGEGFCEAVEWLREAFKLKL
ncbi:phosphoglycolate phosphatase [Candidatus Hecatella orcuttiae]|uniref:phosphoglycolate phosphatase n=1 Tax=Candidatus Hecatella orcuttiae TaxID=1935119 RepID=UPI0028682EBB|nr:phosphoglycolate phosphatase [Candidatus Hecatella orcuttiae]